MASTITISAASSTLASASGSAGAAKAKGKAELGVPEADAPDRLRGMVACRRCYLVKTYTQFYSDGCDNCPFLGMKEDKERCDQCTTSNYQGLVASMRPTKSWVAKWQGLQEFCSGVYAMRVNAELAEEIKEELRTKNVSMFPPEED